MYYGNYNDLYEGQGSWGQAPQQPEPPKKKKEHRALKVIALALVCVILGAAAGVGGSLLTNRALLSRAAAPADGQEAVQEAGAVTVYEGTGEPVVVNISRTDGGKLLSAAEVYASNVNGTVGINTEMITTNVYGQPVSAPAAGSGFIITSDGYIVTNYHVIEDAASIEVNLYNGDTYKAKLVGGEEENDIAVLKIEAQGLTPVRLGSSSTLVVGEDVVAIGNPLGELTFSETRGIVSALDRTITMSDGTAMNVLQTDCAINSGNSGGALFNMYGQVIGITNAKYSSSGSSTTASIEGLCFAIPIDDVKGMIYDIMEHGYVTGKPFVGVTLSTANAQAAARYGRSGGAYVQSVIPGAAADKAGLRKGDIITAVDGVEIGGHAEFIEIKNGHKAGDTVTLTVDREGRTITLTLTFDEKKPEDRVGAVDAGDDYDDTFERDPGDGGYSDGYGYGGGSDDGYGNGWGSWGWPFNFGW